MKRFCFRNIKVKLFAFIRRKIALYGSSLGDKHGMKGVEKIPMRKFAKLARMQFGSMSGKSTFDIICKNVYTKSRPTSRIHKDFKPFSVLNLGRPDQFF